MNQSPYYQAAQIFDPQRRTSFLKEKGSSMIPLLGQKRLAHVRKLWERFRDNRSHSSYEAFQHQQPEPEPAEQLSAFHRVRQQNIKEHTRPQSNDEFEDYISSSAINIGDTISIKWWNENY